MPKRKGEIEITVRVPEDLEGQMAELAMAEKVVPNDVYVAALRHFLVRQLRHAAGVAVTVEGMRA